MDLAWHRTYDLTASKYTIDSSFSMAQDPDGPDAGLVPPTQEMQPNNKWSNFETVFTNAKAGMAGVDKEHIKRIVYEMSKVLICRVYRVFAGHLHH